MQRISYHALNARQQEAYNFQKISAILADYGFVTMRLSSDWRGADFIAQHIDGSTFLPVQLKGRLTFDRKYQGRGLHVCFPSNGAWYLYPHDEFLEAVDAVRNFTNTESWRAGTYHFPRLTGRLRSMLAPYRLTDA